VRRLGIKVTAESPATAEVGYALLADGASWPAWSPIDSVELETPGDPPPEGVGAIRVNRRGRTTGRDQIIELIPNRRIRYATLSGLPIRMGEVDLQPAPGSG
jgi:Polyketide cyclase / dehydrase and lipid transport